MSEKITFKELVELIAEQSRQSQNSTSSFISELVELIEGGLKKSGSVSISGFGKFELRWMNERAGVNPQTGESITIPGQNKVVFKPYKALREDVNRPYAKIKAQILESADTKAEKEEISEPEVEPKSEPIPLTAPTSASQDEESDLILEREIPDKKSPESEEDFQPFDEPEVPKETEPVKKAELKPEKTREPVPILTKTDLPTDKIQLTEEVQKAGNMNWSYAAAAIVVALVIVAILFLMRGGTDQLDSTEQITQTQNEQLVAPSDQTEQEVEVEPEPEEPPPPFLTETYQIEQGDSLWSIAEREFGNPYLWPLIYDMNPDLLDNPNVILAGINLTIPIVPNPENLTDDQLEMVASGYYSIYEWALEAQPDQAKHFLWAVGVFSPDKLSQAKNRDNREDWAFAKNR